MPLSRTGRRSLTLTLIILVFIDHSYIILFDK